MTGFTRDEKVLAAFGNASFLHMWTWPNLFRDQGKTSHSSDGKEICDLTVIFGNTVILFSDKRIKFNSGKPLEVAWSRWARRAVSDSLKQLRGAERWIKINQRRVFVDKTCAKHIPILLPQPDEIQFIRIVVAHGVEGIAQVKENEGSLSFTNELKGSENWQDTKAIPFTLGLISETEFVHVFTGNSISYVLSEFDTAQDFISYLMERENLFLLKKKINVSKESDIIHLYYENYSDEKQAHVILSARELLSDIVSIAKKPIESLHSNPIYQAKKKADKVSYFWDELINSFAFHALNGSSLHRNWEHTSEIEPALRVMASPGRFDRRVLSEAFMDFYYKAIPGQRGTRIFYNPSDPSIGYLFLLMPYTERHGTVISYRDLRNNMLQDYALIYGGMHSELSALIGVAAQTRMSDAPLSEDFFDEGQDYIYMDCENWDEDMKTASENLRIEYENHGLLVKRTKYEGVAHEFPPASE